MHRRARFFLNSWNLTGGGGSSQRKFKRERKRKSLEQIVLLAVAEEKGVTVGHGAPFDKNA
jgi:hypothetical protein